MSELAIFCGSPVRKKPFRSPVIVDAKEWKFVKQVIENKEFSRFMGSPCADIEKQLVMESKEALDYNPQYFMFLGGQKIREFEAGFAKYFRVKYAISVNSATSGLIAGLGACGIGPGDEVITTCLSFNATAMSILVFNAIPVFVDVNPNNFCLDPKEIEKKISKKTKAILVVHLLGNPADMDSIMKIAKKNKLKVIEDCAQALGTQYKGRYVGTIGDVGIFSFQETKNITTGEGGMIVTNNPAYARKCRLIRNHGESIPDNTWNMDALVNLLGMNFRMTELTAALGIAQLDKLDGNNRKRIENSHFLAKELNNLPGITIPDYQRGAIPHVFALLYDRSITGVGRKKILAALRSEGVPVGSGYLRTMYENPIFLKKIAYGRRHCPWSCHLYKRKREYRRGDCRVAESLLKERFIWFYHINRPNSIADMQDVVMAFKKVFANLEELKRKDIDQQLGYKW